MLIYCARRIMVMIPTLVAISILVFIIIQLPPGDYLTTYIAELQSQGEQVDQSKIEFLRQQYGLDLPYWEQYLLWFGGMLTGDFGYSFEYDLPVSEVVGDRPESAPGIRVAPGDALDTAAAGLGRPIVRRALELAERPPRRRHQKVAPHRRRREVIGRRVARLQHPPALLRLGQDLAVEHDPQPVLDPLEARRPGVVPDRFPPRPGDRRGRGVGAGLGARPLPCRSTRHATTCRKGLS